MNELILKYGPTTILYFTGTSRILSILIPKVNGKGYLKSPFGGHHCNKHYRSFTNLNLENVGDAVDIEGYLAIYSPCTKESIDEICGGLLKVFQRCNEYREITSEEFFSQLLPY